MVGDQLKALDWLVKTLAAEPQRAFHRRDSSGGYPIHALLIANNAASLKLVLELYQLWPRLLLQKHGPGFFLGEHGLHVLAVNRREYELCRALFLCEQYLTKSQYTELMSCQAVGMFFKGNPMAFYGGSILSFAAAFGLTRAARMILMHDMKHSSANRLTGYEFACTSTGFLPLHCAVANGRVAMYNFLTGATGEGDETGAINGAGRLPIEWCASGSQKGGRGSGEVWSRLSPLQLAAKLGDTRMAKHIMRKRLKPNWTWGPLTSLRIELDEIDSAGKEGNDIMEIIADFQAGQHTQDMLLDTFMQGFIFTLVQQKWNRLSRYMFYTLRLLEAA